MHVQDAKKKDSKPQPSQNELLRAAMVRSPPSSRFGPKIAVSHASGQLGHVLRPKARQEAQPESTLGLQTGRSVCILNWPGSQASHSHCIFALRFRL